MRHVVGVLLSGLGVAVLGSISPSCAGAPEDIGAVLCSGLDEVNALAESKRGPCTTKFNALVTLPCQTATGCSEADLAVLSALRTCVEQVGACPPGGSTCDWAFAFQQCHAVGQFRPECSVKLQQSFSCDWFPYRDGG